MSHKVRAFFKSVLAGAVVGAVPYSLVTVTIGVGDLVEPMGERHPLWSLYIAALPLLVSGAVVLAASVVIGIPTALILRKFNWESLTRYMIVGVIAGFVIPFSIVLIEGGEWSATLGLATLGALSGAATASVWSRATLPMQRTYG